MSAFRFFLDAAWVLIASIRAKGDARALLLGARSASLPERIG